MKRFKEIIAVEFLSRNLSLLEVTEKLLMLTNKASIDFFQQIAVITVSFKAFCLVRTDFHFRSILKILLV